MAVLGTDPTKSLAKLPPSKRSKEKKTLVPQEKDNNRSYQKKDKSQIKQTIPKFKVYINKISDKNDGQSIKSACSIS